MDKASVLRIVALLASLLAYFGLNIPQEWHEWIAGAIMLGIAIYSAWKNNYLSRKGQQQKAVLKDKGLD
jgi:SPP1 family holin